MVIKIAHTHARATQALLDALERSVSSCCDNNVLLVVAHKPVWHVPAAMLACLKPVLCCAVLYSYYSVVVVLSSTPQPSHARTLFLGRNAGLASGLGMA